MPDLTAHDLYELVKGLPEEARPMSPREPRVGSQPDGAVYYESAAWWMVWGVRERTIPIAAAILIHEASVMRWLNAEAWLAPRGDGWELVGHCSSNDSEDFPILGAGPTRLHALVAAAEAVAAP